MAVDARFLTLAQVLFTAALLPFGALDTTGALGAPDETTQTPEYSPQELAEVTEELRSHYYARAWELGTILGKEWNKKAPDATELRAWYALNLARNGDVDDGIEVAEDLLDRAPEDPWAWFAMAGTVHRHRERSSEALEASEKALALRPDDADFLSARADVIRTEEGAEECIAWIDDLPPEQSAHSLVQIRKAVALHGLVSEKPELEEEAFALFREVMALDPEMVEAPFFLGSRLQSANRLDEALPLLEAAADLSPSFQVHEYLWRGIQARRDIETDQKNALVEMGIQRLFEMGGETPGALLAVARTFEGMDKNGKRDELWTRILTEFPESGSAEWVLVNQYRNLQRELYEGQRETGEEDPELKARYRRKLEEFLMRPNFQRETLRGDAFRNLLFLLRDDEEVDPGFLYAVVRGVEQYEGINTHIIYGEAPTILADHGSHLDYAEELALKGIDEMEKQVEEYHEMGIFDTQEEAEEAANSGRARMLDALAWVHFNQGRIDDAEGELLEAYGLSKRTPTVFLHLGRLYEKRHSIAQEEEGEGGGAESFLDQAQDFYLKGSMVPIPGENPNDEALETLYESRNGSMDEFEEYMAGAASMDADARKEKILSERLDEPKTMEAFELETLTGETISSESLAGKVVVINFWGTWCGPCVIEMPEIQKFHDQFKGDEGVAVLTLANDPNPDVIHRFMEEKEYTFPVMLDDGYVRSVKVRAFPTTWFVDPDGKIWFEKRGWSEELAQEFTWRVEALRGG